MQKTLETASLDWRNANTPVSSEFGDVYFSADDGFAESRYVYLENNFLPQRFSQLAKKHFTIAETGFGTGLNFLLAWQCWQQYAPSGKKLFYISTECFPLAKADLQQSLACWPELAELSARLCASYPLPIAGLHNIELEDGVTLLLLLGDATEGLQSLLENSHPLISYAEDRAVDAWFLDGFAPDKNPGMWTPELFSAIAKLSKRHTTFASFTAAGMVRRGLQATGFAVEKVKGYGKKREMIRGEYIGLPLQAEHITESSRARPYGHFWPIYRATRKVQSVLVIGAGIAGFTTAKTLANAGIAVTLVDSHSEPLQGASGNPQAMLFAKFSHEGGTFAEFNLFSYLYATRFYRNHYADAFHACGMLQMLEPADMAITEKMLVRFQGLDELVTLLDAHTSSARANTAINQPCLWLAGSGWLQPLLLRENLLADERIRFIGNTTITTLLNNSGQWLAHAADQEVFTADAVVLCNAHAANALLPALSLPTKAIRGQISVFPAEGFDELHTIVCHEGYIAPAVSDHAAIQQFTCGASYDLKRTEKDLLQSSQTQNINTLKQYLPKFSQPALDKLPLQGRVEFRCSTPDYLPAIGPVPNAGAFIKHYRHYAKNSNAYIPVTGKYHEGLMVNIAHGSRGFSTAPISAELIRAYLLEQPYPLPFDIVRELHPARFLIRDITRRKHENTDTDTGTEIGTGIGIGT
jgi:tRNA 5-methylaminomethyl-2-thiouridine biosynthesis bifunctional protein